MQLSKATLLHLRIPFSFFLMPIFCFALSLTHYKVATWKIGLCFFIWHLLVYPASNGFNSFYDKDKQSIGGLEKPPPTEPQLLYVSLLLDLFALILAFLLTWQFALAVLIYGLVSKAYSHTAIRLKKFPYLSWLAVGFFQGAWVIFFSYQALTNTPILLLFYNPKIMYACLLSACFLLASYPMTQVYQHEEDAQRGDLTISRVLGIKGTFVLTAFLFLGVGIGFCVYFLAFFQQWHIFLFQLAMLPVILFFFQWAYRVWQDEAQANFRNTMRLNLYSAIAMNIFFLILGF
ncbi:MAG: UbiA family prenyltransferase [Microscillaceae bacterium]|nr:UbiA family prenyltransferase [Microscillaceae bacterium]MDW8459967.1 UbiA family prenyltransferase [Cytophagales bacterium]